MIAQEAEHEKKRQEYLQKVAEQEAADAKR